MSQEMASQPSIHSSASSHSDDDMEDEEEDFFNYYEHDGDETEMEKKKEDDPEHFEYELLAVEDVERLLNESVESVCKAINVRDEL